MPRVAGYACASGIPFRVQHSIRKKAEAVLRSGLLALKMLSIRAAGCGVPSSTMKRALARAALCSADRYKSWYTALTVRLSAGHPPLLLICKLNDHYPGWMRAQRYRNFIRRAAAAGASFAARGMAHLDILPRWGIDFALITTELGFRYDIDCCSKVADYIIIWSYSFINKLMEVMQCGNQTEAKQPHLCGEPGHGDSCSGMFWLCRCLTVFEAHARRYRNPQTWTLSILKFNERKIYGK